MLHYPPGVDPGSLTRLRELVRALHEAGGPAVPLAELARLAGEARLDAGLTVDFAAAAALGQPLVVLRVPAGEPDGCLAALTRREREVAGLLAEGLSNKQVARRLSIKLATVKDHVHRILAKTGLPNRAAVAAACRGSHPPNGAQGTP